MERYSRNRIYVSEEEQRKVSNTRILFAGAGIGSVIAECAMRFGFERLTIIDGDKVELGNLNRQNYTHKDIGSYKAGSIVKRLKRINPEADVTYHKIFITEANIKGVLGDYDIAINALDFSSDIPFVFDSLCSERNIPVLHPYNFGWAGCLAIVKPRGCQLSKISNNHVGFELQFAEYIAQQISGKQTCTWLRDIVESYKKELSALPPPQLSIGSWMVAGLCTNAMFNIATGKDIKFFPDFYLAGL